MFSQKIPKSQLPDKALITTYYPHTTDIKNRVWSQSYYRVVSIDPGIKNFAFRIETRSNQLGISTEYFHPKTEVFEKVSFSHHVTDENTGICNLYSELNKFLDQYEKWYPTVHMVIVEKQMAINYKMVRLSQHVITYFHTKIMNMPYLPSILEVSSKLKTNELGAPKGLTPTGVKKWAIQKAYELLAIRSDETAIGLINETLISKKDDLADTVIQIEAVFTYYGLPLTQCPIKIDIVMDTPSIPSSNNFNLPSNSYNHSNHPSENVGKEESIILPTDPNELDNMSLRDIISNITSLSISSSTITPNKSITTHPCVNLVIVDP